MQIKRQKIWVINGPNLNMLGIREKSIYGTLTLSEIKQKLEEHAQRNKQELSFYQSSYEGALVDWVHEASREADALIINAAAYSHTSIALVDAISAIQPFPVIEVHLSNTAAREEFRHKSLLSAVCIGKIEGFSWKSYVLALRAFTL